MLDPSVVCDPVVVFSILPDGSAEPLRPGLVPPDMPLDPIEFAEGEEVHGVDYFVAHRPERWLRNRDGKLFRVQVVSDDPVIQAGYLKLRTKGMSHRLAEKRARTVHPDLIYTAEEQDRLDAAFDVCCAEGTIAEVRALPWRMNDPSCAFHRYCRMRIDGQSHRMAVMLATRSFPGVRTDATFNEGRCNGNQFEAHPALGDQYRRIADASGVSTTGKWYCSGLADYPGDPTAWVSDRGDVLRVARLKGYKVSGAVEYDPGPRDPMPDVPIADDILQDAIEGALEDDPGQRREDVEDRMFQLLTGAVDPNPLRVSDPPPEAAFED
jgi:hypothetical protein